MGRTSKKTTLKQEQNNAIIQLVGLFLAVYSALCYAPTNLGQILSVPFTFLFGLTAPFIIALLLTTGLCMLVFKRVFSKYLKTYQIFLLIASYFFILALLTLKDEYSEMTFSTCFKQYISIYDVTASYSISGEHDLLSLNGGMLGYIVLGTINRFTDMSFTITKILTISLTVLFALAFIIPLSIDTVNFIKKEITNAKLKRLKEKKEREEKLKPLLEEKRRRLLEKEAKAIEENKKKEEALRRHAELLGIKEQEKANEEKEKIAKKEEKRISKQIKKELKQAKKEEEAKEDNSNFDVTITRDDYRYGKEDDLLETTEINISGENFNYVSKANTSSKKLKNIIEIFDDEIYSKDFKELKTKSIVSNEISSSDITDTVEVKIDNVASISKEIPSKEEDDSDSNDVRIFEETVEIKKEELTKDINLFNKICEPEIIKEDEEILDTTRLNVSTESYSLPYESLLVDHEDDGTYQLNEEVAKQRKAILREKMDELGVQASVDDYVIGPAVTRFEITLSPGVRVATFTNLIDDFKLALGVNLVRVESPIQGRIGVIGLEVPNTYRSNVYLKEVIQSMPDKKNKLYVPVGKDITGAPISLSIYDMPHMLVSGSTGSGKSVCVNGILTSLLLNYRPDEIRFIMIDPKRVELLFYKDLPHLLCPIITDSVKARVALEKLCDEMDKRFTIFSTVDVKTMKDYNELVGDEKKMPFILLVIDEFAELMTLKDHQIVEEKVQKIAQLGRAAGIHLLIATQRPDVNVIPGVVKNNLPCRLTFRLSSLADSRTVIDASGAEKLLNNGDMLLLTPDYSGLRRVQGVFVSDKEISSICNYCKNQMDTNYASEFLDLRTKDEILAEDRNKYVMKEDENEDDGYDPLYEKAKQIVIHDQKASSSYLIRKLQIGYGKAARFIDMLEEEGIIGPDLGGSRGREVLVKDD